MTLASIPGGRGLLVAALFLIGCGGDSGTTGNTTTSATDTSTTATTDSSVTTDSATATETTETDTVTTETSVTETTVTETADDTTPTDTEPGDTTPCEGEVGCACDQESPCDGELVCHDGECAACQDGWAGCDCEAPDETCESGAVCDDGACVACADGSDGCPCRPLGSAGGVCDGDLVCLADRCVDDACALGAPGCPCGAGGACDGGGECKAGICLACDPGSAGCACDGGACDQGNVCAPSNTCIAATSTCDTAVTGSVGQTCQGQNKVCTTNPTTGLGSCGGCASGYVLEGANCRAVKDCAAIGCTGSGEVCTAATANADATCACDAGYTAQGDGCRLLATCASLGCSGLNKACATPPAGQDAVCGACLGGYVDVSGTCQPDCATLGCATQGRTCNTPANTAPSCGGCLSGWLPNDAGTCIDVQTCSETTCQTGTCVEADPDTNTNAYCDTGTGCPDKHAQQTSGACVACVNCDGVSDPAGATGEYYPSAGAAGTCVCKTTSDFYIGTAQGNPILPCDADGDGWVRRSFVTSRDSVDPLVKAEATCATRKIDRFLLVPDEPGGKPQVVLVSDLGLTVGVETDGANQFIELFEPDALDDDTVLTSAHTSTGFTAGHTMLRAYGELKNGTLLVGGQIESMTRPARRRFVASELNPMTKFCHEELDDYNWNNIADAVEWHASPVSPTLAWMTPFVKMSYFGELHRGLFVPAGGNATYPAACQAVRWNGTAFVTTSCVGASYGAYVIREKDRSLGAAAPVALELSEAVNEPLSEDASYGVPAEADYTDASYWRECRRNRAASYDSTLPPDTTTTVRPGHRNFDFARFNCPDAAKGSCFVSDPFMQAQDMSVAFDGRKPVGPRVVELPDRTIFAGMNHHSQFRCMQPRTTVTAEHDASRQILVSDLDPDDYHLLECGLSSSASDRDAPPDGSAVNPRDPAIDCRVDASPTPGDANGDTTHYKWVVTRFQPYTRSSVDGSLSYTRGCIDESVEWPFLCEGFDLNPFINRASPSSDEDNFGHIECGCTGSGGRNCEVGCGTTPFEQIDPPYSPVSRQGYWMCGDFSLATPVYDPAAYASTPPDQLPAGLMSFEAPHPTTGTTGTWTVRSQIGLDAVMNGGTKTCASLTLPNGAVGDICVTP
ncbi:MAG: hypothetical protein IT385_06675 [Deltaproteobacteria bacterium]|nr:hypothetical protein [Deltaproteobacteria bacterium]